MKRLIGLSIILLFAALTTGCDAFRTLSDANIKTSQGKPYELILVCPQAEWTGEVGDTLRAILTAPVPYINQTEPLFDVLRVTERGFRNMIAEHRNILKVLVDPSVKETTVAVQYDVTAQPQVVLTLQGPDDRSVVEYLSQHRAELVRVLEMAERDRDVAYNAKFGNPGIEEAIRKTFGIRMNVPKGYLLAASQPDFLWARYEYPTASQGFVPLLLSLRRAAVAHGRSPDGRPQPVRGPHPGTLRRLVHDHLGGIRARPADLPA